MITVVIALAIITEAIIEYAKTIMKMAEDGEKKTAITQCAAIVLCVSLAFAFNANMFDAVGINVNAIVGTLVTGVIASRGSNYIHDFLKRIKEITVG